MFLPLMEMILMYKIFLLFLLSSLCLFAATPKLFKPIGDPIYKEIPAVISLSKMHYFKNDKKMLNNFIQDAKATKKLGFTYDKKRKQKTLTKQEQKDYLDKLRDLKKQLKTIYSRVRVALSEIIKKRYVKTFYALKRTRIDILHLDPKSASKIRKFEYQLTRKKRLAKQKKAAQLKADKLAYYKFLRSDKNLNGKWKGKSNDDTKMAASFNKSTLYLTYKNPKDTLVFKGSYKITKNTFDFFIEHRKRTKSDISHIKKVVFGRVYTILELSENKLVLKHKDEIISLKPQTKK